MIFALVRCERSGDQAKHIADYLKSQEDIDSPAQGVIRFDSIGYVLCGGSDFPDDIRVELVPESCTDDECAQLAEHPLSGNVVSVDLGKMHDHLPRRITDRGLADLASLPNLEKLILSGADITPQGAKALRSCQKLVTLDMGGQEITDEVILQLENMPNLKRLLLGGSNIGNVGLAHISEYLHLKELDLTGTHITADGLLTLTRMQTLRTLCLNFIFVDNAWIPQLAKLAQLQCLDVTQSNLSEEDVKQLEIQLPTCNILS